MWSMFVRDVFVCVLYIQNVIVMKEACDYNVLGISCTLLSSQNWIRVSVIIFVDTIWFRESSYPNTFLTFIILCTFISIYIHISTVRSAEKLPQPQHIFSRVHVKYVRTHVHKHTHARNLLSRTRLHEKLSVVTNVSLFCLRDSLHSTEKKKCWLTIGASRKKILDGVGFVGGRKLAWVGVFVDRLWP